MPELRVRIYEDGTIDSIEVETGKIILPRTNALRVLAGEGVKK